VKTDTGYILIDTGWSFKRTALEKELVSEGCEPGNLKMIIVTHGDFDHTGNCAYLREKYGTVVAMHPSEAEVTERGDMMLSRKNRRIITIIVFKIVKLYGRLSKFGRFKPDLYIEDGYEFSGYGFDARVLHIPGHSNGSIGILTNDGDLFCGDLLTNKDQPAPFITDDSADFNTSIEKLRSLEINTVYPGHGKPFPMELFIKINR
jgi:hydroxyacylglutathione hydrolase